MSKAFFVEADAGDLTLLQAKLENAKIYSAEQISACLQAGKVRHYIPDKVQLAKALAQVMQELRDRVGPQTQVPLLNLNTWQVFWTNLKNVMLGLLSGKALQPLMVKTCLYCVLFDSSDCRV